jgi:hypothetical protein
MAGIEVMNEKQSFRQPSQDGERLLSRAVIIHGRALLRSPGYDETLKRGRRNTVVLGYQ